MKHKFSGFTLVEIAIVMFIMALMLGTGLTILSAQQDQQKTGENALKLDEIREALIGFAITYGRLPCPASTTSNGQESFAVGGNATNGNCSEFYNGFVPAATLGLSGVNDLGFLLDSWGDPIRYAVTTANTNTATTTDGIKTRTMSNFTPDLHVCSSSPNPTIPSQSVTTPPWCGPAITLTSTAPAVIYSTGKNSLNGGSGTDELANANPRINPTASPNSYEDKVFVSHALAPVGAAGGEFDDQLIWLSQYTLFNRMVQAGKLP